MTYTVTGSGGCPNATATRDVTITEDTTNPIITCPNDITENVDSGMSTAVITYVAPTGTDDCSGITINQIAGLPSGSAFPIGLTINTFEIVDAAGNRMTCSFNVEVLSNIVIANDDNVNINGDVGGNSINVVDENDLLNGNNVMLGVDVEITSIVDPNPSDNVTLDSMTGEVLVLPNTPAGDYTITYTLCNITNPIDCDDATITITVLNASMANLDLTKTGTYVDANNDDLPNAGDEIRYTFTVENTGNVDITNIILTDPLPGVIITGGPIDLAVGEENTTNFTAQYELTEDDIIRGEVSNQAMVIGQDLNGNDVIDLSDDTSDTTNIDIDNDGDPEDETITRIPVRDDVIIFTGISPNGDGINDELRIVGLSDFPSNTLRIYNRWGVVVFEENSYEQPGSEFFKGFSNGRATISQNNELPVGTYYYVIEYMNASNFLKQETGYIYINR